MAKNKRTYHFDVEIITDTHVYCITSFQISHHKIYRGIDTDTLIKVLKDIETYEIDTTINIRGVNY